MKVNTRTAQQSLAPAYRKEKVTRAAIDRMKRELPLLLDRTANVAESEENHKGHFQTFLHEVWFREADCLIAPKGRIDLVIHDGPKAKDDVGVLIEAKRGANTAEMFHPERPNCKALRELVLYFLRERQASNTGVKTLMITDVDAVYVFADREFERLFWEKKRFRDKVLAADADPGKTNATAYEIIGQHLEDLDDTLECTVVHLPLYRKYCEDGDPETDDKLLPLYKILSPVHLLRRPFAGDSNHLDKGFYRELLHIIGLEEVGVDSKGKVKKNGGKKIIRRATGDNRHAASLLENVLQVAGRDNRLDRAPDFRAYGNDLEERRFGVALELCTTWVNRVLFLKLLESQLLAYHRDRPGRSVRFLTPQLVTDYDALNTLFIDVLNTLPEERQSHVAGFGHVPYLNSSLFEISALESATLEVSALKDQIPLPLAPRSILGTRGPALKPLEYLFAFLDAYDFSSEGKARIQEENKRLINASVLGLVFEKINGYRDGSFYTPGFITEYMCRQTIRRAVTQKFRADQEHFAGFDSDSYDDLRNFLARDNYKTDVRLAANALVNSLTVCDPAVGSGHFLVSALNEIIATKSDLGILGADAGAKDLDVRAVVENDELLVHYRRDGEPYEYLVDTDPAGNLRVAPEVQIVQQTLFEEKRTLIENCLFGVDLNPNSVKICRLRLWIELLKHAYYVLPDEQYPLSPGPRKGRLAGLGEAAQLKGSGVRSRAQRADNGGSKSHIAYRDSHIAYLQTLPNIDINIKQGNSLISRFALDDDLSTALKDSGLTLADYRRAVSDYHAAKGQTAKDELRALIARIKDNFETHIYKNDKRIVNLSKTRGKVQQLEGLLEVGDLFGSVDAKKVEKELKPLRKKVAKLEAELQDVTDNVIYQNAFEWRFEFPAVLGEDGTFLGFDVVVGNPPYVSIAKIPELKAFAISNYATYAGKSDIYALFIERASKIIKNESGVLSFIISNGWLRAKFGVPLRNFLTNAVKPILLINFEDDQLFAEATVETCILSLESSMSNSSLRVLNVTDSESFKLNSLQLIDEESTTIEIDDSEWVLASKKELELKAKVESECSRLGDLNLEITYGIRTGLNEAFVINQDEYEEIISKEPRAKEIIGRILRGKDIAAYTHRFENQYVILSKHNDHAQLVNYPEVLKRLNTFEKKLKSRGQVKNGQHHWLELDNGPTESYLQKFKEPKIMWAEISDRPQFCYDIEGFYTNNKVYIMRGQENLLAITGILNSSLSNWYFNLISSTSGAGTSFWLRYKVESFPVKENLHIYEHLTTLVTRILTAKRADAGADTSALEAEIDVLVYKLYGLSYGEVLVVDAGFGLGEEEYAAVDIG